MSNFVIVSDTACDLPLNLKEKHNVETVAFSISFDGQNYLKENIDIQMDDFYKRITTEKIIPKTSLPSIEEYMNCFRGFLETGKDVLCFSLSSELSGSHQSALNAASILSEDFPDRKILVLDTKQATVVQGLLVLEGCKMRDAGFSIEETYSKMNVLKDSAVIVLTIDTLEYLQKGGRIGKASALAGGLLNIKPIMLLKDGAVQPHSKARGRKKSLAQVIEVFGEFIKDDIDKYEIVVANAVCMEDAVFLENAIKEKYNLSLSYPIFDLGVAVGSHVGPTTVGVGLIKKYDA